MIFKIDVDEAYCKIAIAQALKDDVVISNRFIFAIEIKKYIELFGKSCIDDHGYESTDEQLARAAEIVSKYYLTINH